MKKLIFVISFSLLGFLMSCGEKEDIEGLDTSLGFGNRGSKHYLESGADYCNNSYEMTQEQFPTRVRVDYLSSYFNLRTSPATTGSFVHRWGISLKSSNSSTGRFEICQEIGEPFRSSLDADIYLMQAFDASMVREALSKTWGPSRLHSVRHFLMIEYKDKNSYEHKKYGIRQLPIQVECEEPIIAQLVDTDHLKQLFGIQQPHGRCNFRVTKYPLQLRSGKDIYISMRGHYESAYDNTRINLAIDEFLYSL